METLDWIVIGLFCLALVGIIVWVMRQKQDDSKDYFLGGRDATWIAIGASIFASNIGSEHLIGLAGNICVIHPVKLKVLAQYAVVKTEVKGLVGLGFCVEPKDNLRLIQP